MSFAARSIADLSVQRDNTRTDGSEDGVVEELARRLRAGWPESI